MFFGVSVLQNSAASLRDSVGDVPIFMRTIAGYTLHVLDVLLGVDVHFKVCSLLDITS